MDITVLKSKKELSLDEICTLMKNEKDVKVYKKLCYFRFKALAYDVKNASLLANFSQSMGYHLDNVWEKDGYYGLLPKKYKSGGGRKTKLNKRQKNNLKKYIKTNNELTINKIKDYIKNEWNIDYTYMGVKKLLINEFNVNIDDFLNNTPRSNNDNQKSFNDFYNFEVYDEELFDIINLMTKEKDLFVYKKLLSFILIKFKIPLEVVGDMMGVTKDTLLNWSEQWVKSGYEGLLKKKGQGRKPRLTDKNWEEIRKKLLKRDDWLLFEIQILIKEDYGVFYDQSHLAKLLRRKFKIHFAKPYSKDYRQSPYYKQIFHLKLYHIFKKFSLRYDPETNHIINMDTMKPFHIFSFDEASFQFTSNNVKFWSLIKPLLKKDASIFQCKTMGSFALSDQSNDYLQFVKNKKSETVIEHFENLRKQNPEGDILLLIDNYSSHSTDDVLKKAEELGIILCFLPTYSPQLQPIEKVWKDNKRDVTIARVTKIDDYSSLSKTERTEILKEIVKESYVKTVKSKNKWNKVLNNYIKPKIKSTSPEFNTDWEVEYI